MVGKSSGPLTIRLTEPITFLRGSATGQDFRGRPQITPNDAPPAMVRGLLTLRLHKANRIRRIEIQLRGTSRTEWPEGIGPRRMETSEEHVIISETVTFFTAYASHSRSRDRRAVSVGPGSYLEEESYDDFDADEDDEEFYSEVPGLDSASSRIQDRGRAVQRGGAGRSFSVASERFPPGVVHTTPSSRRQSFDRHDRPDGPVNGAGPSAYALREAILTRERGPSPAYTPQDPLAYVNRHRAASRLRNERGDAELREDVGLSPIPSVAPSAVQSDTSRDPSLEPNQTIPNGPTRPSVGAANAHSHPPPHRGRIPSFSAALPDDIPESDGSAQADIRRQTTHSLSSHSTASSMRTNSHPASPAAEDPPNLSLEAPAGSDSRDRRDSAATERQDTAPSGPPLPAIPQEVYISVSRRGSRQTSLVELIPSPAVSPSLRPADGFARSRPMNGHGPSPASSRRSSALGTRPSLSQLRGHAQPSGSSPLAPPENAVASSSASSMTGGQQERGRRPSKFSLSAVSSTLRGLSQDVKRGVSHAGRASSRAGARDDGHPADRARDLTNSSDTMIPPFGRGGAGRSISTTRREVSPPASTGDRSESRGRGRTKGLKALNGALGLEDDGLEAEGTHNWKEFRKGTYNYPISFAIPASSPPTIHADFGSVTYRLRATVIRAGALTPNYVEDVEVMVIASPNEDDLEETENVIVERQWEDQMRYLIALSGKAFPIGGTIPMSVRMMPMSKCKIYRLSATIEEKVDYFALERKVARHEAVKRYPLLSLRGGGDKQAEPLLPIISDSPHALRDSPLVPLAIQARPPGDSEDDAVASLLNPHGPWFLESNLHVPDCASHIRFSTKHAKTNMTISHWLKVVIRVERGDDVAVDTKGRRKQFDIIIETPLHLLDCRVNTQYNTLPTYSTPSAALVGGSTSHCSVHGNKPLGCDARIGASTAPGAGPSSSRIGPAIPSLAALAASFPVSERRVPDSSTSRHEDGGDTLLERNIVYDRLVSGQESEAGEAPPTYVEALSARHSSRSRSRPASSASRSRSRLAPDEEVD